MKTKADKIQEFLNSLQIEIDLQYHIDCEEVETFEDVRDQLEDRGIFEQDGEVIYYSNAIKLLSENDPSLQDSMGMAHELGFEVESINSELLATLLNTQMLRDEFYSMEDKIEAFLLSVEDEE